jgi:hypothetical protein
MLGTGFEPVSSARKAEMIGRTTPRLAARLQRRIRVSRVLFSGDKWLNGLRVYKSPCSDRWPIMTRRELREKRAVSCGTLHTNVPARPARMLCAEATSRRRETRVSQRM